MPDDHTPTPPPTLPDGIALAGIGDEAGAELDTQLAALTGLGWGLIELRNIDGVALGDLDDAAFDHLRERLSAAGLSAACVDARIANWGRPITGDFEEDLRELAALAPRCHALGTNLVRVMSYPNDGLPEDRWRAETLTRIAELTRRAEDAGLVLVHENCAGWAGREADRMLDMLEHVDSPALRLLFDIGNGVAYDYEAHALLADIAPHVAHVHVKDAVGTPEDAHYTLPGQGRCRVADCLRDLLAAGYRGVLSIEPHISVRPHEALADAGPDGVSRFVAYGRTLERLIADEVVPAVAAAR
ncbi:sugar phosphate isomerase/epimerase family protein [Streptomyces profundus]|uniref:sugar phosphate isomerase/epimerase family protein n=1 Tax=Streptomyces profundus TaxID=2867410 RepID=UPI001D167777|nr:sugar phosphate isomerase/epimerase family protein [Streptomyces sp. MA3_2.13]UED85446.1 sugar phosphate isomerase/epimerase [Streptomyces sp. MA3_2.13]